MNLLLQFITDPYNAGRRVGACLDALELREAISQARQNVYAHLPAEPTEADIAHALAAEGLKVLGPVKDRPELAELAKGFNLRPDALEELGVLLLSFMSLSHDAHQKAMREN